MNWKKGMIVLWALFAVCLVITVFLFIPGSSSDQLQTDPDAETVTLEVYAWTDETETFEALKAGFSKTYKEIEIQMHYFPSSEQIQGYQAALGGSDQVDLLAISTAAAASPFIDKGQICSIDEMLASSSVDFTGISDEIDSLKQDGKLYLLPYRNSAWVVYYNLKMFDEMGIDYPTEDWTWEDYADIAESLSIPENNQYGSLNFDSRNSWWRVPARTAGAENPMVESDLALFTAAAEWNYNLTYKRQAAIPYNQLTGTEDQDYIGRFLRGEAAMMYCGEWCLSSLNSRIESEYTDFCYDIVPLPSWEEGETPYAIGSLAVLMMAEKSENKEEALLFMEYACSEEGAKILAANQLLPVYDTEEIRQIFCSSLTMPEHSEYFFPEAEVSSFPATTEYTVAINVLHENIWRYLTNEIDLDTALSDYNTQLTERLKEQ